MKTSSAKETIEKLLRSADIKINGSNPWDIQVHDERLYDRVLQQGSLGAGETFLDGWWSSPKLDEFFYRIARADIESKIKKNLQLLFQIFIAKFFNLQTKEHAFEVGEKHYDLGNDIFKATLDSGMSYTCGYWKNATNLEQAQQAKLQLAAQKLMLQPGMRVLDIGCGWGSLAKFFAAKYQVEVVGVTVSVEQANYAKENCRNLPVDIRLQDYRDINETFDRIVSLGMFEHVGHFNYQTYMQTVHHCLKPDGIFLLHTIGANQTGYKADEWITKYIFPGGMLPSVAQIGKAIEKFFIMEDWHNFGADYDKTLLAWYENFNRHWPTLSEYYDEKFYRRWTYYLLSCAGAFRARSMQLWQVVLTPKGIVGGYVAPR